MRRAKIVCTLGPSAETVDRLIELMNAGMNVARLNMSHGDYEEHGNRLRNVRAASEAVGKTVGVFADLQGPKIRLGRFVDDQKVFLATGAQFTITTDDILGNAERCSTTYKGLPGDVNVGDPVVLIGRSGDHEITVAEIAETMGTIPYEVTCLITGRVTREYR